TTAVQAKNGTGSASDPPPESDSPSGPASSSGAGSSSGSGSSSAAGSAQPDGDSPAITMPQGGKRSDATIPKAAMPPPDESLSKGNGHPDVPPKPLGASAPDPVVTAGKTVSASSGPANSGSASPAFASSASSEPDTLSRARTPSAGAKPPTPS